MSGKTFELDRKQTARVERWCQKHGQEKHVNGVRDFTGAAFKFTFLPSGIGDNATVECIWCPDAKCVLSIGDDGEFLYNEDGTPNGWSR